MSSPFRVGVTRDFLQPDGSLGFGDIGLSLLDEAAGVEWEFLPGYLPEFTPAQIASYDALLVMAPRTTAASLEGVDRLKLVARFGVGYDNVDVDACTRGGVMLTITPDGVRRPVAVAALTFVLALSHRLVQKDRLTREGRWSEKLGYMGMGITGRTLGIVGLGNIGGELARLARPLGFRLIAADPVASPETARELGAELVPLEALLAEADYVVLCCALNSATHHLIDGAKLARMKPTAYLVNVSRGPVVDEAALVEALRERRIAGAGLDVFEQEPPDPRNPLFALDNVIVAPHALCWTDECFLGIGRSACGSILDLAAGRVPRGLVNRDALSHPKLQSLQ